MASRDEESLHDKLQQAIINNKIDSARELLLYDVPVNSRQTSPDSTPLHWAIRCNTDIDFIALLVSKGANIHIKNSEGETPLQLAVRLNNEDVVKLFLNNNALTSKNVNLLITEATMQNNENLVKLFVTRADQQQLPIDLREAVNLAVINGYFKILQYLLFLYKPDIPENRYISNVVMKRNGFWSGGTYELLLQHGFTINPIDEQNFEFAYAAADYKCLKVAQDILKLGIDINAINTDTGMSLLHVACMNRDAEMVKLLITYKVDLNIKTSVYNRKDDVRYTKALEKEFIGKTALFIAVFNTDVEIVNLLLMNGADVSKEPNILITAAGVLSIDIIKILISYGAKMNNDDFGGTPLHYCLSNKIDYGCFTPQNIPQFTVDNRKLRAKIEIATFFLKKGVNVNVNKGVTSPLQLAIAIGSLDMVKLFLQYNADIDHSDAHGNTPLHFAVSDVTIFALILGHNPNINAVNNALMTPLHVAAVSNNYNVLNLLLSRGANVHNMEKDGNTALHLVIPGCNNSNNVKVLLNCHAEVNVKNKNGETPFHVAALHNCSFNRNIAINIFELLLKYNADINSIDYYGRTPLAITFQKENDNCVAFLLKHGADANWKDENGKTLLHKTAIVGDSKRFQLLIKYGADINDISDESQTALDYIKAAANEIEFCLNDPSLLDIWEMFNLDEYDLDDINVIGRHFRDINERHPNKTRIYATLELTLVMARVFIYETAREHIIKLHCAKLKVSAHNFNLIYVDHTLQNTVDVIVRGFVLDESQSLSQIEDRCYDEIKKLKCEKIGHITLHNVLIKDIHDLTKFTENEKLVEAINADCLETKYPLYADIIRSRFTEAVKRSELLMIALKYSPIVFYGLPITCVDQIFSYLDDNNLNILISSIEQSVNMEGK